MLSRLTEEEKKKCYFDYIQSDYTNCNGWLDYQRLGKLIEIIKTLYI